MCLRGAYSSSIIKGVKEKHIPFTNSKPTYPKPSVSKHLGYKTTLGWNDVGLLARCPWLDLKVCTSIKKNSEGTSF